MLLHQLAQRLAIASLATAMPTLAFADALNVQLTADIRSSQPGVNRDAITDSVMLNIVEGLVAFGERGDVINMLADSREVSEDRLTYTFHLRDGVTFHNGSPLTAEDVKFSWDQLLGNAEFGCANFFDGRQRAKIEDIAVIDAMTVAFTLDQPDEMFLGYMAQAQCGATGIVHRSSFNDDGTWNKPIGTGPFTFGEWKRGETIQLLKFDGYSMTGTGIDGYGGRKEALVDEVRFVVVPDTATAAAGLRSGALDILPYLPPSEAAELRDDPGFTLVAAPHGGMITMLLQTSDPLIGNVAMRRAIVSALDTPEIVDSVTYGLGIPNNSLVSVGSLFHTDAHNVGYDYDPSAVPALLEEAGYKGEKITILTNRRSAINYDTAVIAQAMLQSVGINADIEVLEWASQLDRFNSGNFQIMAFNYSNRPDPVLAYRTIVGSKAERANAIWDDADVIELVEIASQEPDQAKRQAMLDDLHTRFLDAVPMIMLANGLDVGVSGPHVSGYRTWQGFARLWGVDRIE